MVAASSFDTEAVSANAIPTPAGAQEACDLVMKGGITSGVVYPKMIHQLSQRYRFKNIGGTSAGAIAAGACAAAEYGRQHGAAGAFERLSELPEELGQKVQPSNRSRLLSLFQPHADLRTHFAVLLQALNQKPQQAVAGMLLRVMANHKGLGLALLLVGAALLAPLIQSQSTTVTGWMSVGMALTALVLVGLALWRTAVAPPASVWRVVAAWLGVYLLLALGLKLGLGVLLNWALAGVALSLLLGSLMIWVLLVATTALRFVLSLLRGLHRNRYGMCSGRTMPAPHGEDKNLPGLTDWLTGYFDELGGLSSRDHALTFGDLWGSTDHKAPRDVNLEVMTSAVSQQMIYSIPLRDGAPYLYYDPDELNDYFPTRVMKWLNEVAAKTNAQAGADGMRPDDFAPDTVIRSGEGPSARNLRPFPRGANLPVVVAVRMSLSFPVLLSAVPLYAVDHSRQANQIEKERMRTELKAGKAPGAVFSATRIWFSDGGIGSNMPLHMFDALLPGHPTFAVNLKPEHPDFSIKEPETKDNGGGRIFLPENNRSGRLRYWAPPNDAKPLRGLAAFLLSIVDTMQNWRDEIQFPYPGFRDRIVQISQRETEGGLNLDMPASAISALGDAGAKAADRLIDRFHPAGAQGGAGWTEHQTVRLGTFLGTMQPGSAGLCQTINSGHWTTLTSGIDYSGPERQLAKDFLTELGKLGALGAGQHLTLEDGALKPVAQIRISPKI